MNNLKQTYKTQLRCSVCGADDCFEYSDDRTYIRCMKCGKEYLGGYDELVELNQDAIDSMKEQIKCDMKEEIMNSFREAFKGNKHIKIK